MTDELERIERAYKGYKDSNAADRWSLTNRGNRAALRERERATYGLLRAQGWIPLGARRVLEVGCGAGHELARMLQFGASAGTLAGVDLIADRVAQANRIYPQLDIRVANAEHLDFADATFDLVMAITLFSSISERTMARRVAGEAARVLKTGGGLLWYDFRYDNPRNPNVHGVDRAEMRSLFPGFHGRLEAITLLPPLSRRLGPMTQALYPLLASLPPLRTHLLGLLIKAA